MNVGLGEVVWWKTQPSARCCGRSAGCWPSTRSTTSVPSKGLRVRVPITTPAPFVAEHSVSRKTALSASADTSSRR